MREPAVTGRLNWVVKYMHRCAISSPYLDCRLRATQSSAGQLCGARGLIRLGSQDMHKLSLRTVCHSLPGLRNSSLTSQAHSELKGKDLRRKFSSRQTVWEKKKQQRKIQLVWGRQTSVNQQARVCKWQDTDQPRPAKSSAQGEV